MESPPIVKTRTRQPTRSDLDQYIIEQAKPAGGAALGRYWNDPSGFVLDCFSWPLGTAPADYQLEIMDALPEVGRVSARGPHGLGKTTVAAWLIIWFALTRDGRDWKIVTTASVWRQLKDYLWPEVHKWVRRLRWDKVGRSPFVEDAELLQMGIKLETGSASAVASDKPAHIEGAHADHLLYVFDESKTIQDATFDAAEGAFAGADADNDREAFALAISTPGPPDGRFHQIHARAAGLEDWHRRHVTLAEAVEAGRISQDWADKRRAQWGENSAVYQNRVLGEFAADDVDGLIALADVERAIERWHALHEQYITQPPAVIGVDVARFGSDETVLAYVVAGPDDLTYVQRLHYYNQQDIVQTTDRVQRALDAFGGAAAVIDVVGIGAGVFDNLRHAGYSVRAFSAGEGTDQTDRSGELMFADKRSAAWWRVRELLQDDKLAIPDDDKLTGDLLAPKWAEGLGGKIRAEKKLDIRKRIGRSTNAADAVIMALWEEIGGATWADLSGLGKVSGYVSPYA